MINDKNKVADVVRKVARFSLLFYGTLIFIFSLLSGAEDYGNGVTGIIKNIPNSFPWLLLLVLLWISWKKELLGGILLIVLGLTMLIFFVVSSNKFHFAAFMVVLPVTIEGVLFVISWYLRK
jgi:uncharacterized membrane protein